MDNIDLYVESLIFASEVPIGADEIKNCVEALIKNTVSKKQIEEIIQSLQIKYSREEFSFEIVNIGNAYQFLTKYEYYDLIGLLIKIKSNKKLSKSTLETLAVIAYQQPVSKAEIEKVRGVNCDYAVQKLLEKDLIKIVGRSKDPGRPLLYGSSEKFMEHFGLSSLQDLPKLKEIISDDNIIGNHEEDQQSE
jgi:segregation and condensation protein B